MRTYLIQITNGDGTISVIRGIFTDGFSAVIAAMDEFFDAKRISAWRIP